MRRKTKKTIEKVLSNRDDLIDAHRTLYDVDTWTIIKKNIIAGFSRSIGAWIFNIIVLGILVSLVLPLITPYWNAFFQTLQNNFPHTLPT